jgi:hypothetical protein
MTSKQTKRQQLLLCKDHETGEYTMTVSEQWLGKHVPAETNMHVTTDVLWKRGVFYVTHAETL